MSEALTAARVTEELRSDLIKGYYPPGDHLSMSECAKRYGVGRPAMRLAFKVLEEQYLLEKRADVYYVFKLSINILWQVYKLNHFVAKESPRGYLSFNPAATTFGMFPDTGDIVLRTERFYEINAELAGGHDFLVIVRRNNAHLYKLRVLKDGLIEGRGPELDEIIDSERRLDFVTYDRLVDQYLECRLKRLPDLFYLAQQVIKRPA